MLPQVTFLRFLPCLFQLDLLFSTSLNHLLQLERTTQHPLGDCCTASLLLIYSCVLFSALEILGIEYLLYEDSMLLIRQKRVMWRGTIFL